MAEQDRDRERDWERERRIEHQHEQEIGQKGGAAEAYAGHGYYEPTITAVTDLVVPATRIQWGPIFAGLLITLSVAFLFTALGVGIGLGARTTGYWVFGFTALGLFLGAMMTSRTARAGLISAIAHGFVLWALFLVLTVWVSGSLGSGLVASLVRSPANLPAGSTTAAVATNVGWYFFIGFVVLLIASILGAIAGMNPVREHETRSTPVAP